MNPVARMQPQLSNTEWDLIVALLDAKRGQLPTEIHHTTKLAYRRELEERLELVEALYQKLAAR